MNEIERRITKLETVQEFQERRLEKLEIAVFDVVKLKWVGYGVGATYILDKSGVIPFLSALI